MPDNKKRKLRTAINTFSRLLLLKNAYGGADRGQLSAPLTCLPTPQSSHPKPQHRACPFPSAFRTTTRSLVCGAEPPASPFPLSPRRSAVSTAPGGPTPVAPSRRGPHLHFPPPRRVLPVMRRHLAC